MIDEQIICHGKWQLTVGEVTPNVVVHVVDLSDVQIYEIDFRTKRADVLSADTEYRDGDTELRGLVRFFAEPESLYVNEALRGKFTEFSFTLSGDESYWRVMVETGRYTARIVAYRVMLDLPDDHVYNFEIED